MLSSVDNFKVEYNIDSITKNSINFKDQLEALYTEAAKSVKDIMQSILANISWFLNHSEEVNDYIHKIFDKNNEKEGPKLWIEQFYNLHNHIISLNSYLQDLLRKKSFSDLDYN